MTEETMTRCDTNDDIACKLVTAVSKSAKVKDPKRVAAGKRLAEISKAAKERKMRERLDHEQRPGYDINYGYVIGTVPWVLC